MEIDIQFHAHAHANALHSTIHSPFVGSQWLPFNEYDLATT